MNVWNLTWTPDRDIKLVELIALGWSWAKIGRHYGVGKDSVRGRAAKLGVEHARADLCWSRELDMELRQLVFDYGKSYSEAAAVMGLTKNQLIGRAHRLGWQTPKKVSTTLLQRLDAMNVFPPAGRCVYPIGHPGEDGFIMLRHFFRRRGPQRDRRSNRLFSFFLSHGALPHQANCFGATGADREQA